MQWFLIKKFNLEIWVTLGLSQRMTLTFDTCVLIYITASTNFEVQKISGLHKP